MVLLGARVLLKTFNNFIRAGVIICFGLSVAYGAPPDLNELRVLGLTSDMVEATKTLERRLSYHNPEQQFTILTWFRTPLASASPETPDGRGTDYPVSFCVSANLEHLVNLMLTILTNIVLRQDQARPSIIPGWQDPMALISDTLSLSTESNPPLANALRHGFYRMALHLMEAGADFGPTGHNLQPVLDYLNLLEDSLYFDFMRLLVHRGLSPDARNSEGSTLVHLATATGNVSTVQFMIEHGGSYRLTDSSGRGPIHLAAALGYEGIVSYLSQLSPSLINESRNSNNCYTPLHEAAFAGQATVVACLLMQIDWVDLEADTAEGETALHLASVEGYENIVAALLAAGADRTAIDDQGQTPIHTAVIAEHTDVINLLLNPADAAHQSLTVIDDFGRMPIHIAAVMGNLPAIERMLEILPESLNASDRENDNFTVLHEAVFERQNHVVEFLTQLPDTRIEVRTVYGQTPLHLAARQGAVDCAITLINAGAEVQAQDTDGMTPQALALQHGHYVMANIFQESLYTPWTVFLLLSVSIGGAARTE